MADLKRWARLVALLALAALVYNETVLSFIQPWSSENAYSHGPLLALVAAWFVYHRLKDLPASASWIGVGILLVAGAIWVVGTLGTVRVVHQSAVPFLLWGIIGAVFGRRGLAQTWTALLLLFWAIPLWSVVTPMAQRMTVAASATMLSAVDVPALIEGNTVYLPVGTFEIAAGCAGLHFLIVASAVGYIYAYVSDTTPARKLLIVATSALFAIVMNWLRVTTIIIAGYVSDMQHYLVRVDHYTYGWVLFAVMLLPMFLVFRRIEGTDPHQSAAGNADRVTAPESTNRGWTVFGAAVASLVITGFLPLRASIAVRAGPQYTVEAPTPPSGWLARGANVGWYPDYPGAAASVRQGYRSGASDLTFYRNLYVVQEQDRELIGYYSRLVERDASRVSSRQRLLTLGSGRDVPVVQTVYDIDGRHLLVTHTYFVRDRFATRSADVKLLQILAALAGSPAGGVIATMSECREPGGDCVAHADAHADFLIDSDVFGDRSGG